MEENKELILRDILAIERTKMANERTFLAYFRTAVALFGAGVGIVEIDYFKEYRLLGFILLVAAVIILLIGIIRIFQVKKAIRKAQ
ncbi:putative membrane protein [Catalinimonas alkaloidigena]|uniref:DUF202 domain-containing protein n=1 Tax=Catalinimonas alkaloidigena TaxID=1075417 RepID=UPI00240531F0|nr:DUF202 domain-containing protein [Catalinimonas alkaloidigena]MDF9799918.1 putative membrane protein [Catalinimonas alkaloidigena]